MKFLISIFVLLITQFTLFATLEMGSLFTDNMVIQRETITEIWGTDTPNQRIEVKASWGATAEAIAQNDGSWKTFIQTPEAGGPHQIEVIGSSSIIIDNVLSGEVWLASGQSNMEWAFGRMLSEEEIDALPANSEVKLYRVERNPSQVPVTKIPSKWTQCSPESLTEFSAVAYYFAMKLQSELKVPVGIILSAFGGTKIGPWTPKSACSDEDLPYIEHLNRKVDEQYLSGIEKLKAIREGLLQEKEPDLNSVLKRGHGYLYNGMIHPLIRYSISGVIWYQGESNRHDGAMYGEKFVRMIKGWRQVWNKELPFYFVQLAPYNYSQFPKREIKSPYDLAILREGQDEALNLPKTDSVIITDVGDLENIHPKVKEPVGSRLADLALTHTYRKRGYYPSPRFLKMHVDGDTIQIHFKNPNGLKSRDGEPLDWFRIAGKDKVFHDAEAIIENDSVRVKSPFVNEPIAVRFGWHESAEPNLVNKAGIPVAPFRTDNWEVKEHDIYMHLSDSHKDLLSHFINSKHPLINEGKFGLRHM